MVNENYKNKKIKNMRRNVCMQGEQNHDCKNDINRFELIKTLYLLYLIRYIFIIMIINACIRMRYCRNF